MRLTLGDDEEEYDDDDDDDDDRAVDMYGLSNDGCVDLAAGATRTCPEGRTPKAVRRPKGRLRHFVGFASEERGYNHRVSMVQGCYNPGPSAGVLVALGSGPPRPII